MYGEHSMAVPVKDFTKLSLQLQFKIASNKYVCIYPTLLCAMRKIKNSGYTEKIPLEFGRLSDG